MPAQPHQTGPNRTQLGPTLSQASEPTLARSATVGPVRANSDEFGRFGRNLGQCQPELGQLCSTAAEFGPCRAKFRRERQVRPTTFA